MHWLTPSEAAIFAVNTLAALFVAVRLFIFGLHRRYRYLSVFLVWTGISNPAGVWLGVLHPGWYFNSYLFIEGTGVALMLLVVLEAFTLVLRGVSGIARLTSIYIRVVVVVCALGAAGLFLAEKHPSNTWEGFQLFKQTVYSSALGFVWLLTAYLFRFRVPVNRNTVICVTGFSVYFSCETAFLVVLNTAYHEERIISPILMAVSAVCLIYWGLRLSPEGEAVPPAVLGWQAVDERTIVRRLRALSGRVSSRPPQN